MQNLLDRGIPCVTILSWDFVPGTMPPLAHRYENVRLEVDAAGKCIIPIFQGRLGNKHGNGAHQHAVLLLSAVYDFVLKGWLVLVANSSVQHGCMVR
jgi:hypothetical protein